MHKDLGLTWNSCWFLCQRIREAMDVGNEVLTGIIELDETWVGGKEGSKHADKKLHGHWQDGKIPVFGLPGSHRPSGDVPDSRRGSGYA